MVVWLQTNIFRFLIVNKELAQAFFLTFSVEMPCHYVASFKPIKYNISPFPSRLLCIKSLEYMKLVSVLNLVCKRMEIQRSFYVSSQILGSSTVSITSEIWDFIVMNLNWICLGFHCYVFEAHAFLGSDFLSCFAGVFCILFTHSLWGDFLHI